jgi:plastocyanin
MKILSQACKLSINILIISLSILILLISYYELSIVYAQEETITIVPGASDSSRYRFFDMIEYPISTGKEIKWYNAENIIHNIVIISSNEKTIIAQSANIKPKESFSYTFDKEGEYTFQSSIYDWMKGKIIVTDNIKTIKKSMENDIDIYLSWIPSSIKVGEKVFFKIIFVNKKDKNNQEHIDYSFTIHNSESDKVLYKSAGTHSAWGVESSSYTFDSPGTFIGKLRIEGILFQPIEPDNIDFEIQVK